MKMAPGPRTL